ncbi:hypothetical protein V8B55DRAFT_1564047 [Mucor lusitanicus]
MFRCGISDALHTTVFKLAPTGVTAHNIAGQTLLLRFFGMGNRSQLPNFQNLDEIVKQYPKMALLIDKYSMVSATLLNAINNDALVKTTNRPSIMGGIKTIFFGDIAQLLPCTEEFTIWRTAIYNTVNRYNLTQSVRQKDPLFIAILNKVRLDYFDEDVVQFINSRTVLKKDLPMNCLRLYTTREGMHNANKTDMKDFPGEGIKIPAVDNFVEAAITARRSLSKETRLLEELNINIGMRVMLIQNMNVSLGWVNNGAIATVVEVDEDNVGLQKGSDDYFDDFDEDKDDT